LASAMFLLTSHYLVVLQEDLEDTYGWIISYIPRTSIARLLNRPCGEWDELAVELTQDKQVERCEFHLQIDAARDLRECWLRHGGQWQELTPVSHSSSAPVIYQK